MRRLRVLSLAVVLALTAARALGAQTPAHVKRLRVLATTDVHGHLLPDTAGGQRVGGLPVIAAWFDSARSRFDGATIVVSSGDDMQGTAVSNLSGGRAVIEAMNAVGYDAATVGNHEFDWGQDTLRARIAQSRFPWLAANLYVAGTTRNPAWVKPWVMISRGGVRTAVIGVALASTPRVVMAGRLAGLDVGPEAAAIDRSAREARAAGADFVIVTIHDGAMCDTPGTAPTEESAGCRGDLLDALKDVHEPIDLVLGGHSHRRIVTSLNGIPVVEAASYASAFATVDLERGAGRASVTRRAVQVAWADSVTPDSAVSAIVVRWDRRVRQVSDRPVARLAAALDTLGGDYGLGRMMADAYRRAGRAQVSLVNNGSVRRGLRAGLVTYGDLYELQPFQNRIVVQTITGAQLRAALENALGREGKPDANVSGITVAYDPSAAQGSRVRSIRLDGGRELHDTDRVTVSGSEFVATGGDGYVSLKTSPTRSTGVVDVDALVAYFSALPQPVVAPSVRRWSVTR